MRRSVTDLLDTDLIFSETTDYLVQKTKLDLTHKHLKNFSVDRIGKVTADDKNVNESSTIKEEVKKINLVKTTKVSSNDDDAQSINDELNHKLLPEEESVDEKSDDSSLSEGNDSLDMEESTRHNQYLQPSRNQLHRNHRPTMTTNKLYYNKHLNYPVRAGYHNPQEISKIHRTVDRRRQGTTNRKNTRNNNRLYYSYANNYNNLDRSVNSMRNKLNSNPVNSYNSRIPTIASQKKNDNLLRISGTPGCGVSCFWNDLISLIHYYSNSEQKPARQPIKNARIPAEGENTFYDPEQNGFGSYGQHDRSNYRQYLQWLRNDRDSSYKNDMGMQQYLRFRNDRGSIRNNAHQSKIHDDDIWYSQLGRLLTELYLRSEDSNQFDLSDLTREDLIELRKDIMQRNDQLSHLSSLDFNDNNDTPNQIRIKVPGRAVKIRM